MGLTRNSTGIKTVELDFNIKKEHQTDKIIALAGNPNVGKSTVFNALTGMKQHTGNWPGKTVSNAQGVCNFNNESFILVDIPGTYSLLAHSQEEEIARDFICFGNADAVIVVCDATCLERNLNLVLQTIEITKNVIVCINLMDEAEKKGIKINLKKLEKFLGVPVIETTARNKKGIDLLMEKVSEMFSNEKQTNTIQLCYPEPIEVAINTILSDIKEFYFPNNMNRRWIALKLLENNENLVAKIGKYSKNSLLKIDSLKKASDILLKNNITQNDLEDIIAATSINMAEKIANETVIIPNHTYSKRDRKIDRILTSRITGFPIMVLILGVIFWLTITGANLPSDVLSNILFKLEDFLLYIATYFKIPEYIYSPLIFGVFRVVAWVISVMLPPMAIFFPLFTFLEDLGYLPRIAFNLDKALKKCSACGKQALTMCMGFGCNAAGVVGCRIIDSKRERLIAMLTNSFVPCNGRLPQP